MKPNIIIFNPDEMRADTMGHLGCEGAHTPFLDHLATEEAASFSNAFCQNPVCVPSRCSFTTGLYPHVNGHRTMAHLMQPEEQSLFRELKDQGYYVWMNARNDLVAAQYPGAVEAHASEMYYGGNTLKTGGGTTGGGPGTMDFYAMYSGKAPLNEQGVNWTDDDEDVAAAIDMIQRKPKDQPLCLFLGLLYPHPPYQIERPFYETIDRTKLPARIKPEDCTGKAKILEAIRQNQKLQEYTDDQWEELRTTYFAMVAKVDSQFKKVCDALKAAGEYDNSAIFFMSDHGDFAGDYGLAEKCQNSFEDCLTNVPFLVKPPKGYDIEPGVHTGLVELVDLYATVMDMAQATPSHSHYGKSLTAALKDKDAEIREFVTCEGGRNPDEIHCDEFHAGGPKGTNPFNPYYPRHFAQVDNDAHAKGYMIRTEKFKLVSRVNGADEFYDLSRDPAETTNQIDNPEFAAEILRHEKLLRRWLMETADVVPFKYDERFSEEMIWAKVKMLVPPEYEMEIREKIHNGANMFVLAMECRKRFGGGQ